MGRILSIAKKEVIQNNLVLIYFVLFTFGQMPKLLTGAGLIDFVVITAALVYLVNVRRVNIRRALGLDLILVMLFSLVASIGYFGFESVIFGFFYLIRFAGYIVFSYVIYGLVRKNTLKKADLYNSLILVSSVIAVLGLIQYFYFPDLRSLYFYGWDDHLNRLVSVFLDPAFTGIILTLGLLLVLNKLLDNRRGVSIVLTGLLLGSLLLTYSRSSYIALAVGAFVLFYFYKKLKYFFAFAVLALGLILILPRGDGVGVKLERTHSVVFKIENYADSVKVIREYPLFGVGFNNVCFAKHELGLGVGINSCSGLDNSLLFVLATTGVVGGIVFFKFLIRIFKTTSRDSYGRALKASGAALITHSMFTNTLFYTFVLGWFAILIAISRDFREKTPR